MSSLHLPTSTSSTQLNDPCQPAQFSLEDLAGAIPNFDQFSDSSDSEAETRVDEVNDAPKNSNRGDRLPLSDRISAPNPLYPVPVPRLPTQKEIRDKKEAEDRQKSVEGSVRLWKHIEKGKGNSRQILQYKRVHALQAYLSLYGKGKTKKTAAECAAVLNKFSTRHAPRQMAKWAKAYLKDGTLPTSQRGKFTKVYSLLNEPSVKDELTAFVRSNKWSMNPQKLIEVTHKTAADEAEKEWVKNHVQHALPTGLLRYLDIELFPRLNLKPAKPISRRTACRWLHQFGFGFKRHFKSVYYE